MTGSAYLTFVGLAVLLALTPGPDSLLVLRFSVRHARTGIAAAIGCSIATIVWAALAGLGLAALIEQSAELYRALKVIGGAYLIYLGVQAIRQSRSTPVERPHVEAPRRTPAAFVSGFFSTMTNPKVGLFFLAIMPTFLPTDDTALGVSLVLGVTVAVVGFLYLAVLASAAARATAWLRRPHVSMWIERVSGGILAALGIATAASALEP